MTTAGEILTLTIERPAVGGRMIARHDGAVVLVAGAIPGEQVRARVERVQRGTVWARAVEVLDASPDRVVCDEALACGGNVLAHVAEPRQHALKAEMLVDAFRRIGHLELPPPPVTAARPDGYRTRARIHLRHGQHGFFEEGSHVLCDVHGSRQMSEASAAVIARLCQALSEAGAGGRAELEWAETVDGRQRAAHVTLAAGHGGVAAALARLTPVDGVAAVSWSVADRERTQALWGDVRLSDEVAAGGRTVPVRHHARAFFQGNRFLLQPLVDDVLRRISGSRVLDLYAGVGLFSVAAAAAGATVVAVEGDAVAAADLRHNAALFPELTWRHAAVEDALDLARPTRCDTIVVDPPRTGLSAAVSRTLSGSGVARLVYVSCDPATLARDARVFVAAGYTVADARAFDLFPRTGHVETVLTLQRG